MDSMALLEHLPDVGKALGFIPNIDKNKIESRHSSRPSETKSASSLAEGDSSACQSVRNENTPVQGSWDQTGLVRTCPAYLFVLLVRDTRRTSGLGHIPAFCHSGTGFL